MQFIRKFTRKVLDFPSKLANFFHQPDPVKQFQEEFTDIDKIEEEIKELNNKLDKMIIENETNDNTEMNDVANQQNAQTDDIDYNLMDKVYNCLTKKQREFYKQINQEKYQKIVQALKSQKFQRLKPGAWLNDEIINDYLKQVEIPQETVILTSFQLDLLNKSDDTKFIRIASKAKLSETTKKILAPFNQNNIHWLCFQIDFDDMSINIYDSMKKSYYMDLIQKCQQLATRIKQGDYKVFIQNCPQQSNMYDCGVFTIKNIEILVKYPKANLNAYYDQNLIFYDRIQICHTLMQQK